MPKNMISKQLLAWICMAGCVKTVVIIIWNSHSASSARLMNSWRTWSDLGLRNDTFLEPYFSFFDREIRTPFWVTFCFNFGPKKGPKMNPREPLLTELWPLGGLLGVHVVWHVTQKALRVPTWTVWKSFWLIRGLFFEDLCLQNCIFWTDLYSVRWMLLIGTIMMTT